MATTFTYDIVTLERNPCDGFVYTAHYTVSATDGTYTAGSYGSVGLQRPSMLIPYNTLTKDQVIGWVKDALGTKEVTRIEAALEAQMDEQRAPSKAQGVPWQTLPISDPADDEEAPSTSQS